MGDQLSDSDATGPLAELERRCHERGQPLTPQRAAVYEAILRLGGHPTVDEVYEAVRHRMPTISRATVYRVMEFLAGIGLIARVWYPDSVARYDTTTAPHHHLVCIACQRMIDVPLERAAIKPPALEGEEFEVFDYSVYFRGLCAQCRAQQSRPDP